MVSMLNPVDISAAQHVDFCDKTFLNSLLKILVHSFNVLNIKKKMWSYLTHCSFKSFLLKSESYLKTKLSKLSVSNCSYLYYAL